VPLLIEIIFVSLDVNMNGRALAVAAVVDCQKRHTASMVRTQSNSGPCCNHQRHGLPPRRLTAAQPITTLLLIISFLDSSWNPALASLTPDSQPPSATLPPPPPPSSSLSVSAHDTVPANIITSKESILIASSSVRGGGSGGEDEEISTTDHSLKIPQVSVPLLYLTIKHVMAEYE